MIRHVERESLYDVTREAALEAVFRYPAPAPPRFFLWLRETIAHRALDKLRGELPEAATSGMGAPEAEAMQRAGLSRRKDLSCASVEGCESGELRSRCAMSSTWSRSSSHTTLSGKRVARPLVACRGSAPDIDGSFYDEVDVPALAAQRRASTSTVYNQKGGSATHPARRRRVLHGAVLAAPRARSRACHGASPPPTRTVGSRMAANL